MELYQDKRRETVLRMYETLSSLAKQKIPSWDLFPASDPTRMLLEAVAEFAGDLYLQVKPECSKLFDRLPDYFDGLEAATKPVHGPVAIQVNDQLEPDSVLPAGAILETTDQAEQRQFTTKISHLLFDFGVVHERYESNALLVGLTKRPPARLVPFYITCDTGQAGPVDELRVEIHTEEGWQDLSIEKSDSGLEGFVNVDFKQVKKELTTIEGCEAYWLKWNLKKLNNQKLPGKLRCLTNVVEVEEEAHTDHIEVGRYLHIPKQTVSLPLYPKNTNFRVEIEGDTKDWQILSSGRAEELEADQLLWDSRRNWLIFPDKLDGQRQQAKGGRIFIKRLCHQGLLKTLPAGSITKMDTDLVGITGVSQLFSFHATDQHQDATKRMQRFQDFLLTHGRAASISDFASCARLAAPEVAHVKVLPSKDADGALTVVVAGDSVRTKDGRTNEVLLARLQKELSARALIGQQIHVRAAEPHTFRLELVVSTHTQFYTKEEKQRLQQRIKESLDRNFGLASSHRSPLGITLSKRALRSVLEGLEDVSRIVTVNLIDNESGEAIEEITLKAETYPHFDISLAIREAS